MASGGEVAVVLWEMSDFLEGAMPSNGKQASSFSTDFDVGVTSMFGECPNASC
jgi:hypothetical protein